MRAPTERPRSTLDSLPAPVEAALARWRALSKADIEKTATKLERDGYHVRLVDSPA